MKTIPLTQSQIALVDDEDYEFLSQWKWYAQRVRGGWYAARRDYVPGGKGKSKLVLMHRLLCPGKEIDHRDRNKLNNQKENLRSASHSINMFNSGLLGKSGVRGVHKHRKRWVATLQCHGKKHELGSFTTIEEAKEVRRLAEIKFFGEAYEPKAA